jgi:hypothetical protein
LSHSSPDFFRYIRLNFVTPRGGDFYDGVFLAPIAADHPQAWRCYNEQILRRCKTLAEMHNRNPEGVTYGIVVLRTQVGRDRVRDALAVARTFHQAVRMGLAVVAVGRNGLDMLLVGPMEAIQAQYGKEGKKILEDVEANLVNLVRNEPDVFVVPIEELWEAYPGISPIRIANPPGERLADTPKLEGLRSYLRKTRKLMELEGKQDTAQTIVSRP